MSIDIQSYINKAAAQGPNMTKSQGGGGGGDYSPPAAGPVLLRFVGYIELGKREEEFQGEKKIKEKVKLIFECHGKNYPNNDRITITETLSFHEKSNFRKLFLAMRAGDESITHISQLLGKPFRGRITHKIFKGRDGKDKIFARLRDESGYQIGPAVAEDPETGEVKVLNVPEAKSELRLFLWDFADKAMWDSLYIDGQYAEGRSKNVFQEEILQALNFRGSALDRVLNGGQVSSMLDEVDTTPKVGGAFRPQGLGGRPQRAAAQPPAADPFGFNEYDETPQ